VTVKTMICDLQVNGMNHEKQFQLTALDGMGLQVTLFA
jgi:hypothetical protein